MDTGLFVSHGGAVHPGLCQCEQFGLRLAYMFVTYVLYEALYTCVNVPFGTLSSVMTDDVRHRTALSRYRSLGGTIFMTVIVMVGPLVLYVDNKPVAGRFLMQSGPSRVSGMRQGKTAMPTLKQA